MPARVYYDGILASVEKPSRYIGHELNLSCSGFVEGGFNILLVFPDVYEIGMTHQGLRLLYDILFRKCGSGVEFAFAPWPDMEKKLRSCGEPLRSWQTGTPLSRFDLIGFTIPYELHYTNLLMILELSGIPLESAERKGNVPMVVAGGPCVSNPLPVINALDAVFLGDGEESLPEAVDLLMEVKARGGDREESRRALASVDGVYVDGITESASARRYMLIDGDLPRRPIVPCASIVHERLSVEIQRGCTRGCRFCHAGMIYRPRRERSINEIVEAVCSGLDASGWEEVSLLSLSTSDYSRFDELLKSLQPELKKRKVSLALPSLRPETICSSVVSASTLVRKSGFTIAPEAGTERLRRVINKSMTDDEILEGCASILEAGWQTLKLYFMIGLPTETEQDLEGIASLVDKILKLPRNRRRFKLNISISPFVPKVQTPFQWEKQCSIEEIAGKERFLAKRIRQRNVQLSMRDPRISALEGVFARGTRDLWPVLLSAYRSGCRFDGWRDHFRFDLWEEAIKDAGFSMKGLLGGMDAGAPLPWSCFETVVNEEFLLREREKAFAGETTEDCRVGECSACGACRNKADMEAGRAAPLKNPYSDETDTGGSLSGSRPGGETVPVRYRCSYSKTGPARYISHREFINILHRALRRSGLPLSFSGGFHPLARISAGPSLAVGIEGINEFFDIELTAEADISPEIFNVFLPVGIKVTGCTGPFTRKQGKLPPEARYHYRLGFEVVKAVFSTFPGADRNGMLPDAVENGSLGDSVLPDTGEIWYRFSRGLATTGDGRKRSGDDIKIDETFGDDPVRWLAGQLNYIFESGRKIIDHRGRERSCDGCGFLGAAGREKLDIYIGANGSPGIRDILSDILPRSVADIIRIKRTGIYYLSMGRHIEPMELVDGASRE